MFNWFTQRQERAKGSPATPEAAPPSAAEQMIAIAQNANITRFRHESSKNLTDLIQGTVEVCMETRATERGILRFTVKEDQNGETPLAVALQRVLDCPNIVQPRTEFLELCSQWFDATGNAAILIVPDDKGMPSELWCMPGYYFEPKFLTADNPIPYAYSWNDARVTVVPEQLIFIRRTSVKVGPYKGRGILAEALLTIQTYDQTLKAQLNHFLTGGIPRVALEFPAGQSVTPEQAKEIRALWSTNFNSATGLTALGFVPDGGKVHDFGEKEIDYQKSKEELRDAIREHFRVPKILLGDTDDVNHNNGQTALAMFERFVVLRFGNKVADALQHHFQQYIQANLTVELDQDFLRGLTPLPSEESLAKKAETATVIPV